MVGPVTADTANATDTTARNIAPLPTGNDVVVIVDKVPSSNPALAADCDLHSPGSITLLRYTTNGR